MWTQWDVAKGWDTTAGMSWGEERLISTHLDSGAFPLLTLVYEGMILCTYMEGGRGKWSCLHIQLDQGQYIPRYPDVLQDFKRVSPDVWIYRKLLPDTVLVNFFQISKGWRRSATFTGKMLFLPGVRFSCPSWFQHYWYVLLEAKRMQLLYQLQVGCVVIQRHQTGHFLRSWIDRNN